MQSTTLTDRQERFVREYMIDQNATQAAVRCGYSPRSARTQGAELMKHPGVKRRVRDALDKLFTELDITAARLMRERARIAFFNPAGLFDGQGQPIPLQFVDADTMAALNPSYEMRKGEVWAIRVRAPNRAPHMAALEKLLAQFRAMDDEVEAEADEERRNPRMTPEKFDEMVAGERRQRWLEREARFRAEAEQATRGSQAQASEARAPKAPGGQAPAPAKQAAAPIPAEQAARAARPAPEQQRVREAAAEPVNPARLGFRSFEERPRVAVGAGEVWIE